MFIFTDEKKSRSDKLKEVCISSGLAIVDVPADGDCMLHAIADQLQVDYTIDLKIPLLYVSWQ